MQNPWDVRPRQPKGDSTADAIFLHVGASLTAWELLESYAADVFDSLVSKQPSNRAAFAAYRAVAASSARNQLLQAAIEQALTPEHPEFDAATSLGTAIENYGARRNEIAHGVVFDLEEHGFYLAPNNLMRHKWTKDGVAKFQYTSSDIAHYQHCFWELCQEAKRLSEALK